MKVLDERPVESTGCLNISKVLPDLSQPVEAVQSKTKSMFTSALRLQSTMELQRKGYLPSQRIEGRMLIENHTGEKLESMSIDCIQRIIYSDGFFNKKMSSVLNSTVLDCSQGQCNESVLVKDFQLQLPPQLMPSWESADKTFRLFYMVQVRLTTTISAEMLVEFGCAFSER